MGKKLRQFLSPVLRINPDIASLLLITLIYIFAMLSVIKWGIPGANIVFPYHMDEWHQLQAVKGVFKHFSNNIPGAAHGPMFQFILSGIYLMFFYLIRLIDPFHIKNIFDNPLMLQNLFITLRLNSLIFGVLSMIIIYIITKRYLRLPAVFSVLLFTATPIWISLSNYFKYDIALIFWMLISILWMLKYRENPSTKNFILSGIFTGLTVATKISALPLILSYISAFFLFTDKKNWKLPLLFKGLFFLGVIFFIFGIPDIILHVKNADYTEFLYACLIQGPNDYQNMLLPDSPLFFLIFQQYPTLFGHGFFLLQVFSFIYGLFVLIKKIINKELLNERTEIFIHLTLIFFLASLAFIKLSSSGNRSLVILPLLVIECAYALKSVWKAFPRLRQIIIFMIVIILGFQIAESYAWLSMKLFQDPRQSASIYINTHLPKGARIGIENIPIYQMIPDIAVKNYYFKQYYPKSETKYDFTIVDKKTKKLPPYIILSSDDYYMNYYKISSKNDLSNRLKKEGYSRIKFFPPNFQIYKYFGNQLNFYFPILVPQGSISIYKK